VQPQRVAGTYAGKFTSTNETKAILDASDGRKSPTTGAVGPARGHVADKAGTTQLAQQEKKTKTCYVNNAQQDRAVKEALDTNFGQAQLAVLDTKPAPYRVVIANTATGKRNANKSIWDAVKKVAKTAKQIHTTQMTLIVESDPALPSPDLHIQTAYPL
jgi:hypothetical protein